MIHQSNRAVNRQRTPLRTYKPDNANVVAAMTYRDSQLGVVAVSRRSSLGVMRASTAIHFDTNVFDRLVADGVTWLECQIRDTGITYRTHIDTMFRHGQLQRRFGLQRVLHLKYWSIVGDDQPQPPQPQTQPAQLSLFGVSR